MLAQNGLRLKIILSQKNKWDYDEFKIECEKAGTTALPMGEWAQKAGMLSAAINRFPGFEPDQAYKNFIHEMNPSQAEFQAREINRRISQDKQPISEAIVTKAKPSCCGGGASL